jgi:A/G-specific adenine glycosylase
MLQQTTVAMATEKFLAWMTRFPTVEALAAAEEGQVLAYWQGLGYYSRARRLHAASQIAAEKGLPQDFAGWLSLPGLGRYSAGAVSSIGLGLPVPLVDGNVVRVVARFTGDDSSFAQAERNAWLWAEKNLNHRRPGDWNQALMELGATVCTPRNPSCLLCPWLNFCASAGKNPESLPQPKPRKEPVLLEESLLIPIFKARVGLKQIPKGQWWEGLWSFPRARGAGALEELAACFPSVEFKPVGKLSHVVTHHKITLTVYLADLSVEPEGFTWVDLTSLADLGLALPAPHLKALRMAAKLLG